MAYIEIKLNISDNQKMRIKKAFKSDGCGLSIRLNNEDLKEGSDMIVVTQTQLDRINTAKRNGKGILLKMSKKQIKHNIKVEGGFLAALLGAAAKFLPTIAKTVLPALGVGALSGLGSVGVQKAFGKGLYLNKGGGVYKVQTDGSGLYLSPVSTGSGINSTEGLYDGNGILLGKNSPFNNIPLLGMFL